MTDETDIKIISGVPRPPHGNKGRSHQRKSKYKFASMEVGDSFILPAGTLRGTVSSACRYASLKYGHHYITHKYPDGRIGCWRTG